MASFHCKRGFDRFGGASAKLKAAIGAMVKSSAGSRPRETIPMP
jgi:hypothetical protein